MSMFNKISDLLKININDIIDKADNPEKTLKQLIIDMEEQLIKSTQGFGMAMGSLNQVKKQLASAQEQCNKWQKNAIMALENGNEIFAKEALANKVKQEQLVDKYQEVVNSMEKQVQEVKFQVEILKSRLDEARGKQVMILAKNRMDYAKTKMSESLVGVGRSRTFGKTSKNDEKILKNESAEKTSVEVSGTNIFEDESAKKIQEETEVNNELEKLKKELGIQ